MDFSSLLSFPSEQIFATIDHWVSLLVYGTACAGGFDDKVLCELCEKLGLPCYFDLGGFRCRLLELTCKEKQLIQSFIILLICVLSKNHQLLYNTYSLQD